MASVYWSLAEVASNPRAQARLKALSETERRHAQAWAELLASCGVKVSERRPYVTARVLAMLARVVGIGPALALAGVAEGQVLRAYLSQVATVSNQQAQGVLRRLLPEELDHQSPDDVAARPVRHPLKHVLAGDPPPGFCLPAVSPRERELIILDDGTSIREPAQMEIEKAIITREGEH